MNPSYGSSLVISFLVALLSVVQLCVAQSVTTVAPGSGVINVTAAPSSPGGTPQPATPSPSAVNGSTNSTIDTYTEVDIIFATFSEARLSSYLSYIAAAAGLPPSRIVPQRLDNTLAFEFGSSYIFPIRLAPPTNISGDFLPANVAAALVEASINAVTRETQPDLFKATAISARRVQAGYRVRVASNSDVNYVWVAFLIVGLVMLISSVGVLLRPRGSEDANDEDEGLEDEKEVPDTKELDEGREKLEEALLFGAQDQAERNRLEQRERRQQAQRTLKMLDMTLEYDRAFALPPLQVPKCNGGGSDPFESDSLASTLRRTASGPALKTSDGAAAKKTQPEPSASSPPASGPAQGTSPGKVKDLSLAGTKQLNLPLSYSDDDL